MSIDTSLEDRSRSQNDERLQEFEQAHQEDLETITAVLVKITHHTPQEIKPHLDTMLSRLIESEKTSVSPKKRAASLSGMGREPCEVMNLPNLSA